MTSKDLSAPGFKEKATRELRDFLAISFYLGFFFCALSAYAMVLLRKYDVDYLNYTFALINALVIAKVILIGEMLHLGKKWEGKPLYLCVLYKSFVFGVLVFAFHLVEEFVKRIIHHDPAGTVLHNLKLDEILVRSLVIFCAFVPLFAFREISRVLGEENLHALLFKPRAEAKPALSASRP
jgi:hypothetical protein